MINLVYSELNLIRASDVLNYQFTFAADFSYCRMVHYESGITELLFERFYRLLNRKNEYNTDKITYWTRVALYSQKDGFSLAILKQKNSIQEGQSHEADEIRKRDHYPYQRER